MIVVGLSPLERYVYATKGSALGSSKVNTCANTLEVTFLEDRKIRRIAAAFFLRTGASKNNLFLCFSSHQ